jgi:hypothetical protein
MYIDVLKICYNEYASSSSAFVSTENKYNEFHWGTHHYKFYNIEGTVILNYLHLVVFPAYIRCATEPYCAAATVHHYLGRYAQVRAENKGECSQFGTPLSKEGLPCCTIVHKSELPPHKRTCSTMAFYYFSKQMLTNLIVWYLWEMSKFVNKGTGCGLDEWGWVSCGDSLEYLHHSPVSHTRRQNGNLVLEGLTGPPYNGRGEHKYGDLVLQVLGWMQAWQ